MRLAASQPNKRKSAVYITVERSKLRASSFLKESYACAVTNALDGRANVVWRNRDNWN